MIATDAEIAGQITATSGTIGGWDVDGNSLRYRNGTSITSSGVFFYPRNIATDNSVILVSYLFTFHFG